ncbi:MAG: hypothetical protein IJP27_07320 [Clostridia bacterium]|nr:hypothetical protein [Clostridia bacterium]
MNHTLYGDGIHDDTLAIQELIDSGLCEVTLPAPKRFYLISAPLTLPSDFRLVLPRFAEVRLAKGASCLMVQNKMTPAPAKRLGEDAYQKPILEHLWSYVDDYAPDAPCKNIELRGGIWNYNNQEQLPNPERKMPESLAKRDFYGCAMLFYNVQNLKLCELTVKDPCQYGITMDTVSYFTAEDITFDYNLGNPTPINMDGIHLDGNCHYGTIQNLKGTCYDDLVALNAHEGSRGDITDIEIRGLFAEYCHSAVRLLSAGERVERIHISDVYGNFYQYCVGLTKYYPGEVGYFDAVTVENVFAAKALPAVKGDFSHPKNAEDALPFLWVQKGTEVETLTLREIHRREKQNPKPRAPSVREYSL